MKKIIFLVMSVMLFISFTNINSFGQTNVKEIKTLKDLYDKRNYEEGYKSGKQFVEKYPDNLELQYWFAVNGSRSSERKTTLESIEKLVKDKGENLWTLLALTIAQTPQNPTEALTTAEKLIKVAPDNEEAILAYNSALFQNKKYADSLNFLNQNAGKIKGNVRFLNSKAVSIYFVEKDKKEQGNVQSTFDLFAQSIKTDPSSVNTNFLYGNYLTREKRFEEAVPFLRKASELSSNVASIREAYWQAIKSQTKKTDEQKESEMEIAIDSHLKQANNSPESLVIAWKQYLDMTGWANTAKPKHLQKRDQLEKLIFQKYPNTKYDEEVTFTKTQRIYGKYFSKDDGAKRLEISNKSKSKRLPDEVKFLEDYEAKDKLYDAERISAERAFLKRPQFFDKERVGQVAFSIFQSISKDKDTTDGEISELIKLITENYKNYWGNLNTDIATLLLQRQDELPDSLIVKDAEKYARIGLSEAENKVKLLPKDAPIIQNQELILSPLNTLAVSLIGNGQLDEAEKLLLQVSKLLENADTQNWKIDSAKYELESNRARFYVAKKDWEKAENAYVKISYDNEYGRKSFEKFYQKKFGKTEGFDNYYVEIQKRLKVRAKERMAESRIKNAQDAIPFSLKNLDDKIVSFADLKGKIIVINVWGTWCGPCVAEMNELQEFHDKYKDDKDVAVLTIDSNDELDDVKKFVADRKLTIPVLIDDGYIFKTPQFSKNAAFPTTFFIDKSGKVAFVKIGNSGNLVEEFSWRVDILKEDK